MVQGHNSTDTVSADRTTVVYSSVKEKKDTSPLTQKRATGKPSASSSSSSSSVQQNGADTQGTKMQKRPPRRRRTASQRKKQHQQQQQTEEAGTDKTTSMPSAADARAQAAMARLIIASEHTLSSQISKCMDRTQLEQLDHLFQDIATCGTMITSSSLEQLDHGEEVTNRRHPHLEHIYDSFLEQGLRTYTSELTKFEEMSREDILDRFPEVVVKRSNSDGSIFAAGIHSLKRKRPKETQLVEVEHLPAKGHLFDDVELWNLFTIDSLHMAKKRKLARAYIRLFKYSFEPDHSGDPVRHYPPSKMADVFFDVMSESYAFDPHPRKDQFFQEMMREDDTLESARRHVLKEKERIRIHDTQSEWKAMAREEVAEVFELFEEQRVYRLRLAKGMAHMCRAELITKKFKKSGQMATDAPQKARLLNRQLANYWKQYEKDIAERRKKRERDEQERRKREQELEEARRQQKKLNFLLTQTELYSHFMAKKSADLPTTKEGDMGELSERDRDGLTMENAFKKAERAFREQKSATNAFDDESRQLRGEASLASVTDGGKMDEPSTMSMDQIKEPKIFKGKLKKYQLQGLNWLASLYEQGINGILADEMGLGKTVQTIVFLAYLAEVKNIWGPFLVVVPSSTLHNWYQELQQFCPDLKVMPYWGSVKERRSLRKHWDPKKLYKKESPFHVLITSYNLILEDEKMFNRIKWQYMILDEAHAIKSSKSARWNTLLRFKCRNRMLLTGTPIQNTMAELWALLHFIMPSLFDSHDEFDEWFSKDIESHAEQKGQLNEQQLARLHMILKPFMLRRVKKDVESEMPTKTEYTVPCPMSRQQKALYRQLRRQLTIPQEMRQQYASSDRAANTTLMNYVMQFRKVCNHPDLFGQAGFTEPLQWQQQPPAKQMPLLSADILGHHPIIFCTNNNPIELHMPRIVTEDLTDELDERQSMLRRNFLLYHPDRMHRSIFEDCDRDTEQDKQKLISHSAFSFARFVGLGLSVLACIFNGTVLERFSTLLQWREHIQTLYHLIDAIDSESEAEQPRVLNQVRFLVSELGNCTSAFHTQSIRVHPESRRVWEDLVVTDPVKRYTDSRPLIEVVHTVREKVLAPPISMFSSGGRRLAYRQYDIMHNPRVALALQGFSVQSLRSSTESRPQPSSSRTPIGMATAYTDIFGSSQIRPPDIGKLVADSGKMQVLDQLLRRLYRDGHRVLIFSQMTKMLDILEEYLYARRYKFFRLDGQTAISDRRDMVSTFQKDPSVFCFLLSTRAGGLGINLTAADTVIFYDSDWNPTMDDQAMDRVHRIGQEKPVSVYRLVSSGTVEERILKIAQQKSVIQSTVYGGQFKADDQLSTEDVMSMLLDDSDVERMVASKISSTGSSPESAVAPAARVSGVKELPEAVEGKQEGNIGEHDEEEATGLTTKPGQKRQREESDADSVRGDAQPAAKQQRVGGNET